MIKQNLTVKIAFLTAAVLAMSGCASNKYHTGGSEAVVTFAQALSQNYSVLSDQEGGKGDWLDAKHFSNKANDSAGGKEVLPDELKSLDLNEDQIRDLRWSRMRLLKALNARTKMSYTGRAAQTQMLYDCWLDGVEEGATPDEYKECRMNFLMELSELEALNAAPPVAEPVGDVVETYSGDNVVYFGTDKDQLIANEREVVDRVIDIAKSLDNSVIKLQGHTDREDTAEYNVGLSKRRVDYVAQRFIDKGVSPDVIEKEWYGETRPAKPTADGVREKLNRRVEISVRGNKKK